MKLMVTAGTLMAGAIIDDKTKIVVTVDPLLAHLRGVTEDKFREHCREKKWAVGEVP